MQYKITKDDFGRLSEEMQKEYKQSGDDYVLNIEGGDVPTAEALAEAKKKQDIEAEHRKNAEKKLKEADDRAGKLQKDLEAAQGDSSKIEEIRKDFEAQIDKMKAERKAEQDQLKQKIQQDEIEKVARDISQGFTVPDVMVGQIAKQLGAREVDGRVVVHPLDENGKESLETIADFKKRQLDKPEWKSIVKVDAGSGGGAAGSSGGVPGSSKKWSELTGTEQVQLRKSNPERATLLMKAEGLAPE